MNETPQPQPPEFRLTRTFWKGLITLIVGSGPLLVIILLAKLGVTGDPNPNPVGFGILAFFTFWPSIGVILWQLRKSFWQYRADQKQFQDQVSKQNTPPNSH